MIAEAITSDMKNDEDDDEQTNPDREDLHPSWCRRFRAVSGIVVLSAGHRAEFSLVRKRLILALSRTAVTLVHAAGAEKRRR